LPDAADELSCMRDSMVTLAALAIRAGSDDYWKVVCRSQSATEHVATDGTGDGEDRQNRRDANQLPAGGAQPSR
jgi:hypothetical protein